MLTKREFEIYMLIVGQAMAAKDIALHLGIAYWTARSHQNNILRKMNVGSSLELLTQYYQREIPCRH